MTAELPLDVLTPSSTVRLLRDRLAAYRRAKTDLTVSRVPPVELYLLANRFRQHDGKIADAVAEIDAELADVMPGRRPEKRRYA
jgi:hypothetical protein